MATPARAAELAMLAVDGATDRNYALEMDEIDRPAALMTDLSDLLANVRHLCDRHGLDYGEIDRDAQLGYLGDRESGAMLTPIDRVPVTVAPATKLVPLSTEAYAVLCGLVAPSDQVNPMGIFTQAWNELRRAFPVEHFLVWAQGEDNYNPEAGQ